MGTLGQPALQALLDVSSRLIEGDGLEPVLVTVLESARQLFLADRAAILQEEESGGYRCPVLVRLAPPELEARCGQCTVAPICGRAGLRYALLSETLALGSEPSQSNGAVATATSPSLTVPLLRRDDTVGTLALFHDQPRSFGDDEIAVARALANLAAAGIEHARLYEAERRARLEAEEARQEIEALVEATREITNSLDLATTLNNILDGVTRLVGADMAGVALLDSGSQTYRYVAVRGPGAHLIDGLSFPPGLGLTGLAAQAGEVINAPDVQRDPRWLRRPSAPTAGVRSAVFVPLGTREPASGVLSVWSRHPAHFTPDHERLLAGLAEQAALAIEHARLFAEVGKIEAMRELDRLKSEFVATVSHELRTPLTVVLGYTDLLLRQRHGPLNEQQLQFQRGIKDNARRLLALINDLLDLSKLEAGRMPLQVRALDPAQELRRAAEQVASLATEKGLGLDLELAGGLPPVLADAGRLNQVAVNLLSNALKFTPVGGRITVRAERAGEQVRVAVADTGAGLGPEQLERVWERFYQAEAAEGAPGTGLGLPIARSLVEAMGGRAWAESAGPGQGATFLFTLPVAGAG